jgi:hypothetical protein
VATDRCIAFAPGRVNLIGEHTDYNDGLSLPFAVAEGVTVTASRIAGDQVEAHALDPAHYRTLRDLDRAFPFGPPSMRRCTRLTVHGEVVFGRDVELVGDVELRGPARIPDHAVLGGERGN